MSRAHGSGSRLFLESAIAAIMLWGWALAPLAQAQDSKPHQPHQMTPEQQVEQRFIRAIGIKRH